jgi:hypothetical protein
VAGKLSEVDVEKGRKLGLRVIERTSRGGHRAAFGRRLDERIVGHRRLGVGEKTGRRRAHPFERSVGRLCNPNPAQVSRSLVPQLIVVAWV